MGTASSALGTAHLGWTFMYRPRFRYSNSIGACLHCQHISKSRERSTVYNLTFQLSNVMVKHESDVDQRALLSSALPRNAHSRTESLLDLYCGIGLWICGTALSSTQLALQGERSQNQLLTKWQDVRTQTLNRAFGR